MFSNSTAKFSRCRLAVWCVDLVPVRFRSIIILLLACAIASPSRAKQPVSETALSQQQTGTRTVFEVNDHEVIKPVNSGRWHLSGVLELKFLGPIDPHENSVLAVFGPGVEGIEGRFERVILPEGWLGDVKYDDAAGKVVVRNLRPNRAPAFPGAEGFGKFTLGGRGGKVI